MKNIPNSTIVRLSDSAHKLTDLRSKIEAGIDEINAMIRRLNDELIAEFNEAINEYNGVLQDTASEIENYIDERSDKWQASDRADAYRDWLSEWQVEVENLDNVEEIDPTFPDVVDYNDLPVEPSVED